MVTLILTLVALSPPTLRIAVDSAKQEVVVELAPLDLPRRSGHTEPPAQTVVMPVDGWLHGYAVDIVDAAGRPLPHELIHHVDLIVPEKRELFSPIMLRLGAAGSETPPVEVPSLLGFRVHRGDTLLVATMFHNDGDRDVAGARLIVRLPYVPASSWWHPVTIYPLYLDVMPPAGPKSYDLPPGHSEQSWEGHPAVSGRILGMGGHVHKYATALRLSDVTTGRVIWTATPITDRSGEIVGMPLQTYWWRLGLRIDPAHTYRLTAIYDNPTGQMIPLGAMGALGGVFIPDDPTVWPSVDRSASDYVSDLHATTTVMAMPGMAGMH
jgi:hypothetical protein